MVCENRAWKCWSDRDRESLHLALHIKIATTNSLTYCTIRLQSDITSALRRHRNKKFLILRPSRRKFSSGRLLSKQSAGESESSSSDSGINGPSSGGGGGGGGFDAMEDLSRRTRETTVSSPISPLKSSDYNPFRENFGATAAVGPRGQSMAPVVPSSESLRYQPIGSNFRSAGSSYSSISGFPAGVREKVS